MRRTRRIVFAAISLVVGSAAAVVVAEATLRIADRPRPVHVGWAGGAPGEQNDFGFRGHKFDPGADLRVVLLGDSQVEAGGTKFADLPEVHLRRALAAECRRTVSVVSIAAGGWGQDQELLALSASIGTIRPAAVVLWFTAENDLWNNTFPTHFPKDGWPKPTFWLEGAALRGPNIPWLAAYRAPQLYVRRALRRVLGEPNYPTDRDWEAHLPAAYRPMTPTPATPSLARVLAAHRGIRVDELPYFAGENFDTEKTHYSIYLVPESPRLRYAATLTRTLLTRIQRLSREHHAEFVIVDTTHWHRGAIPEAPTLFEVNGKAYMLSTDSARRLIAGVLDGFPTIHVGGIGDDMVISKTDHHLAAQGNRMVMESVAKHLAREFR